MTPKRKQRLLLVLVLLGGAAIAVGLGLQAFQENLMYFYSPSRVAAGEAPQGAKFRLGGIVQEGSVQRTPDSLDVRFVLTDLAESVPVTYSGILPDLFREGQGLVTMGRLNANGVFVADEVLAKHDENYMSPEVAEALEKAGYSGTKTEEFRRDVNE